MLHLIRDMDKLDYDGCKSRARMFISKLRSNKRSDYYQILETKTDKKSVIAFVWNLVLSGNKLEVIDGETHKKKEQKKKQKSKKKSASKIVSSSSGVDLPW